MLTTWQESRIKRLGALTNDMFYGAEDVRRALRPGLISTSMIEFAIRVDVIVQELLDSMAEIEEELE